MIVDKIENISEYPQIPDYVINFILGLSKDTECMRYDLIDEDFVNVESYQTKLMNNAKFESHNNYIDVQLLLDGKERIYVNSREFLTETAPYDENRDITFYEESVLDSDYVTLDGTNFVLLYPHEAHAPQVAIADRSTVVKKTVAKIRI